MPSYIFFYDDACPLCKGYTGAFEKLKWSKRRGFSTVKTDEMPTLDVNRGRHEIPLLDLRTREFRYGLDAMTTVLADGLPALRPVFRHRLLRAILKPLYELITYNRRIIVGTRPPAAGFDCAPDFHFGWRMVYLLLTLGLSLIIGFPVPLVLAGLGIAFLVGVALNQPAFDLLGHLFTILLMVSVLGALIPGPLGSIIVYALGIREVWRRLRRAAHV